MPSWKPSSPINISIKENMKQQTRKVADEIEALMKLNGLSKKQVADLFLGEGLAVARLAEPVVIEGTAVDVYPTIDVMDLIAMHESGED